MNVDKFKPLNSDILLSHKPAAKTAGSVIEYKDNPEDNEIQSFYALKVGPDAKFVKEGDVVLASWKRITPPFELGGYSDTKKYGITAEKEILAIIDGD